jgi:AraC-like DNA-binding protein
MVEKLSVRPGVDSRLYAESMATALSPHLLRRYATKQLVIRDYKGGLPKYKLREAIAYINDHLERNLSLAELAALVQMSPYYFAGLFKQSTGFAPHQYVTKCPIEKAKQLLKRRELKIIEICQLVDFQKEEASTLHINQPCSNHHFMHLWCSSGQENKTPRLRLERGEKKLQVNGTFVNRSMVANNQ